MMKYPFLVLDCPQGRAIIVKLKERYQRKTSPGDPIATHIQSCQADVIDWIERMIEVDQRTSAKNKGD